MKASFGKSVFKRVLTLLTAALLLLPFGGLGASAAGDEHIALTIDNTSPGTDINPVIRFFVSRDMGFGSGGPFTVKFEWRIDNFRRMNTTDKPWAFVHYLSLDTSSGDDPGFILTETSEGTDGWVEARAVGGGDMTFENVVGISISGQLQPYAIVEVGLYAARGTLSIRNFRIENAAGKVMYSLDEDRDVRDLLEYAEDNGMDACSLKDIAQINTEPAVLASGFGDNTAAVLVSVDDGGGTPIATTTTHGLQFEDTTAAPTTTTEAADTTTQAEETTTTTEETTTSAAGETTSSSSRATTAPTTLNAGGAAEEDGRIGVVVPIVVVIVIAALLIVAAGVIWILAITGKIKLPFRLPFVKKDGDGPQE
ncbi:MAG TPA: hypothetical protein H9684_09450 [Firmicutes bacterium]|nr:hypothetical protein [Bacillota bacterium]